MSNMLAITGVSGKKSGCAFVKLVAQNIDTINDMFSEGIRIIVRETSDVTNVKMFLPKAEIVNTGIQDVNELKKSLVGVDTLVHISGISYSRAIVEAAAFCNVRRLILVHTTGIYSKYKAAGEEYRKIDDYVYQICRDNNIVLTILRPTMIYGNIYDENVVKFITMVDKFPVMPVVNGANYELQPVHYKDLADAYYSVLVNEEKTANRDFNLSGGKPILLRDMFVEMGKNLDKQVKFISCPFPIAYLGAWIIYLISLKNIDYREKVQRLCEPRVFSHEEATNAFGYNPMSFDEGIVNEVKEYKENKN